MGKVSDYISSLEGKENIDPVVIASTLLELHNEEMGFAESKIASLETSNQGITSEIAERDQKITELKAKNWDLANRVPSENGNDLTPKNSDEDKDATEITFDDFFKEEE
jgi:hypothetical protein